MKEINMKLEIEIHSFEFFFVELKILPLEKMESGCAALRKSREVIKIFRENNNTLNYILGSQKRAG